MSFAVPRVDTDATLGLTVVEFAWVAGYLEGEGSFGLMHKARLRVSASQTERETLDRLLGYFGGSVCLYKRPRTPRYANTRDLWEWKLSGQRAEVLMIALRPHMSRRRQEQIDTAIAKRDPRDYRAFRER